MNVIVLPQIKTLLPLFFRSSLNKFWVTLFKRACGETGRRDRLRICWGNPWRFKSSQAHFIPLCSRLISLWQGKVLGRLYFQSILAPNDAGFPKIDPLGCARSSSAPRPILLNPCHGRRNHKNHRRPQSPNAAPDGRGQKTKNSTIYPARHSPPSPPD